MKHASSLNDRAHNTYSRTDLGTHTTDRTRVTTRETVPPTHRPPRASSSRVEVPHFASIHAIDRDARVYRAVSRDARGETRGCEQTTDVEGVLGLRRRARGERGGNEREGDGGWETRPTGVNVRGTRRRVDAMREGRRECEGEKGRGRSCAIALARWARARVIRSIVRVIALDSRSIVTLSIRGD